MNPMKFPHMFWVMTSYKLNKYQNCNTVYGGIAQWEEPFPQGKSLGEFKTSTKEHPTEDRCAGVQLLCFAGTFSGAENPPTPIPI